MTRERKTKAARERIAQQAKLRSEISGALDGKRFTAEEFVHRARKVANLYGLRWFKEARRTEERQRRNAEVGYDQCLSSLLRFVGGGNINTWVYDLFGATAASFGVKPGEQPALADDPEPPPQRPEPHVPKPPDPRPTSPPPPTGEEIRQQRNVLIEHYIETTPLGKMPPEVREAALAYIRGRE